MDVEIIAHIYTNVLSNEMMKVNLQVDEFQPNSRVCVASIFLEEVLFWLL